jgi:hypothetical protein
MSDNKNDIFKGKMQRERERECGLIMEKKRRREVGKRVLVGSV